MPWARGSCDATTEIDISNDGDSIDAGLAVMTGAEVCDALAVGHVVSITSSGR